ncbi:MAG: beta strand repeat-containing protein [Minwuia sp.]|uniref:beta strand repeat-containing protein n=1 Tax=Minwuia sp. TaxID=2493630 RepID=UPI003A886C13
MAKTEIVLLPEEDGTVGKVAVQNESGEVLLERAFDRTDALSGQAPAAPQIASRTIIAERFRALLEFQAETGFGDGGDLRSMFDLTAAPREQDDGTRAADRSEGAGPAPLAAAFSGGGVDTADTDAIDGSGDDEDDDAEEGEEEGEDAEIAGRDNDDGDDDDEDNLEEELAALLDQAGGLRPPRGPRLRLRDRDNDDDDDDDGFDDDDDDDDGPGNGESLTGTPGNDNITAGPGNDTLAGLGGADVLNGGTGFDIVDYRASGAAVTINLALGTAVGGDAQGDTFNSIEGFIGSNFADNITGDGNDNLIEGAGGADVLTGGLGDDTVAFIRDPAGVTVNLTLGTATDGGGANDVLAGFENVQGSDFADQITGDLNGNELEGREGNDTITAGAGADEVSGGDGDDSLSGGLGNDEVEGGDGNDTILGGDGNDELNGGRGIDLLDFSATTLGFTVNLATGTTSGAEVDSDTLRGFEQVTGGAGADSITGDDGAETLDGGGGNNSLDGGDGNDVLTGGAGIDRFAIRGGEGNDTITDFTPGAGVDDLVDFNGVVGFTAFANVTAAASDDGTDTMIDLGNGQTLTLRNVLVANLNANDFTFAGGGVVLGTAGADTLTGTADAETLEGLAGNDLINALAGNDSLDGGAGDDTLQGGDGDDLLEGLAGADQFVGGAGDDTISFAESGAGIAIAFSTTDGNGIGGFFANQGAAGGLAGDALGDTFSEVEAFAGSDFDDTVGGAATDFTFDLGGGNDVFDTDAADDADETVNGGAGNDTIFAGDGDDLVSGGAGDDQLRGEDDDDSLDGGDGNDDLNGAAGADTLVGGTGNDNLVGQIGADSLVGGAGRDTLLGGNQNDFLNGGPGADRLVGGTGGDTFFFNPQTDGTQIAANETVAAAGVAVDLVADFGNGGDAFNIAQGGLPVLTLTTIGVAYDGTNSGLIAGPALLFDGTHLIVDPNVNEDGYTVLAEVQGAAPNNADISLV